MRGAVDSGQPVYVRKQKTPYEDQVARQLGENVRTLREQRGFSVQFVAELLGVTADAVRKGETGKRRFSVADAFRLAELYQRSMEELIGGRPKHLPVAIPKALRSRTLRKKARA